MLTFNLNIRTPEKEVFKGEVTKVKFSDETGELTILPHHASMTSTIDFSALIFTKPDGTEEDYLIKRGIAMVYNKQNRVDIDVLECIKTGEISPVTAEEYLKFVMDKLAKRQDLSKFQLDYLEEEKLVIEKQIGYLKKK